MISWNIDETFFIILKEIINVFLFKCFQIERKVRSGGHLKKHG